VGEQLLGQPRLADAGLALDHRRPAARREPVEELEQRTTFGVAPDEAAKRRGV
jgi:hypothetical protein